MSRAFSNGPHDVKDAVKTFGSLRLAERTTLSPRSDHQILLDCTSAIRGTFFVFRREFLTSFEGAEGKRRRRIDREKKRHMRAKYSKGEIEKLQSKTEYTSNRKAERQKFQKNWWGSVKKKRYATKLYKVERVGPGITNSVLVEGSYTLLCGDLTATVNRTSNRSTESKLISHPQCHRFLIPRTHLLEDLFLTLEEDREKTLGLEICQLGVLINSQSSITLSIWFLSPDYKGRGERSDHDDHLSLSHSNEAVDPRNPPHNTANRGLTKKLKGFAENWKCTCRILPASCSSEGGSCTTGCLTPIAGHP